MNNHVYFVQQVLSLVNERNAVSKSYTVGIDGVDIIRFLQKEGRGTSNISIEILRRDIVRTEDAFNDKIQGRAWWFAHVPYVLVVLLSVIFCLLSVQRTIGIDYLCEAMRQNCKCRAIFDLSKNRNQDVAKIIHLKMIRDAGWYLVIH